MKELTVGHKLILAGTILAMIASALPWVGQEGGFAPPSTDAFTGGIAFATPILIRIPNWMVPVECIVALIISTRRFYGSARVAAIFAGAALLHLCVVLYRALTFTPRMILDLPRSVSVEIGLVLMLCAAMSILAGCIIADRSERPLTKSPELLSS